MLSTVVIGSKQYSVALGDRLRVEKLDQKKGSLWVGKKVLAVMDDKKNLTVGDPLVNKAQVKALVVGHGKAKKVLVLKKKRRKGYRRTQGHRQIFTELFITALSSADGKWHEYKRPQSKKIKKTLTKKSSSKTGSQKKGA